jgi:5-methylthioadenosine/S-adenosylhomocysteine deaminase
VTRTLVHGRWVLPCDRDAPIIDDGAIIVADERIEAIGRHADLKHAGPFDRVLGSASCAVMPGFCNAHYHCGPGNTVRVGALDGRLETWRLPILGALMKPLDGNSARQALRTATQYFACGMIRAGITSCLDFTHVQPTLEDYGVGTVARAYADMGFRASISVGATNRNAFVYGDDASFLATLPSELARAVRGSPLTATYVSEDDYVAVMKAAHGEHNCRAGGLIRIFLSPYSTQWCSESLIIRIKETARQLQTGIQLHLLESRYQMQYALRTLGKTAVAYLRDIGFLGREVSCAHAVWLTDSDIAILAESGATCVHNPLSNLRLGSGIARVRDLFRAGAAVALGTDGMGFSSDNDMFNQLRLADYLQRTPGLGAAFEPPMRWLELATQGGARVIGMNDELGTLRPGSKADLILIDTTRMSRIGMESEAIDQLLLQYCENEDIQTVMINGRIMMENRTILTVDEDALAEEMRAGFAAMSEHFRHSLPLMRSLEPYVEAYFRQWDTEELPPAYGYNTH